MHYNHAPRMKFIFRYNKIRAFVIGGFLFTGAGSLESTRSDPSYVGVDACKRCHGSSTIGNQHSVWSSSPHAKAFQILSTENASRIAKINSIDNPSKNLKCLRCHTTGGGNSPLVINEGVGCEACHGPGSRYYRFSGHASFDDRENAYRKAITLGMYPILGDDSIKTRERICRYCHTIKRPCMGREPSGKGSQRELPLSLIADFIFRHPVR